MPRKDPLSGLTRSLDAETDAVRKRFSDADRFTSPPSTPRPKPSAEAARSATPFPFRATTTTSLRNSSAAATAKASAPRRASWSGQGSTPSPPCLHRLSLTPWLAWRSSGRDLPPNPQRNPPNDRAAPQRTRAALTRRPRHRRLQSGWRRTPRGRTHPRVRPRLARPPPGPAPAYRP